MKIKYLNAVIGVIGFVALCAFALGYFDSLLQLFTFISPLCVGLTFISIVGAIGTAHIDRSWFFGIGPSILLCLFTFIAVTTSHPAYNSTFDASLYGQGFYYSLYYIIILLYASYGVVRGASLLWLIPISLLYLGEILSLFSNGFFNGFLAFPSAGWGQLLLGRTEPLTQPFLLMLLCGLVPYVMIRLGKNTLLTQNARKQQQSASVSLKKLPQDNAVQHTPPQPQNALLSSKTQMLLVEHETSIYAKTDVNDLLESVVYFMSRNFKAYSAIGFVYDPVKRCFILNSFHSRNFAIKKGQEIPLGSGVVGKTGIDRRSFLSGDLSMYAAELLYYPGPETINSVCAVPILSDTKELLGALVIDSQDKNAFTEQTKEIMRRFSLLAAALITNVRMRMFQEKSAKSFQIFYESSQQFIPAMHTNQIFDVLFQMAGHLSTASRMMVISFNEQKKCGVVNKIVGTSYEIQEGLEFPINAGLCSYAFQKRMVVNIGNYQQHKGKYFRFFPEEPFPQNCASLILIPIMDDEHRAIGLFSLESQVPDNFNGDTEKHLSTLIANASVAMTRARLYQKMELLATTDGLTQLYNHRTFQDLLAKEVERAKRYGRPLSLLLMDIDHFKSFNDTYGHPVGDLVLKEISACIRRSLRINDIPARYGGEEFTVIIPESDSPGALIIAERIRKTVESHIVRSLDKELRVTISLGCATIPLHAQTGQELINNADKALYYSKEHGRNRVTLFEAGMSGKEK